MSSIKKSAIQGGGAMLFARMVGLMIHIFSTVVLARLLAPEDFGLVAMVTAFSFLFYNFGLNGFREAIIQIKDINQRQLSSIFWIGLALSSGLAVLFSLCSPLLARFFNEPRLVPIAISLSVGFIFSAIATEHMALLMRNMQFMKLMLYQIIVGVITTAIAIWMALNGFGYWAIVARHLSGPILSALCVWLMCPWRPGRPSKDPGVWPIIKFAYKTFGIFLLDYFTKHIDKVLIGRQLGSQELGYYDRAYHLFVMPTNQLITPLSGVALATLSRLQGDAERYKRYYIKALSLLALIGMLVSVIMTINGQDIVLLLLGPQWQSTGKIFSALGPAIGMSLLYGTIGWLHLSQGNPGRWLKWGVVALIITAVALLAGLHFGAIGVALAYSLSFYILTWPGIWYATKPMGVRVGYIWKSIWRYFLAAILSGFGTWWIAAEVRCIKAFLENMDALLRIVFSSVLCSLIYFLALSILYRGIKPIINIALDLKVLVSGLKTNKA